MEDVDTRIWADKRRFKRCMITFIVSLIAVLGLGYLIIGGKAIVWAKKTFIPAASFARMIDYEMFMQMAANGASMSDLLSYNFVWVIAAVLAVICYLGLLVFAVIRSEKKALTLVALLCCTSIILTLFSAIIRLLLIPISYVVWFSMMPIFLIVLGVFFTILQIVFGCKIKTIKYKIPWLINDLIFIIITTLSVLISLGLFE